MKSNNFQGSLVHEHQIHGMWEKAKRVYRCLGTTRHMATWPLIPVTPSVSRIFLSVIIINDIILTEWSIN